MSLLLAITFQPQITSSDIPKRIPTTVKGMIVYYSQQNEVDESMMMKMADCESDFNPNAVGDNFRARNVYQYHRGTFDSMSKLMGEKLNYDSAHDQIKLTTWIAANYPSKLNSWTSYRAIKNGGTYSFYSSLLKKHYTVTCK